jgi:hypothetical protein
MDGARLSRAPESNRRPGTGPRRRHEEPRRRVVASRALPMAVSAPGSRAPRSPRRAESREEAAVETVASGHAQGDGRPIIRATPMASSPSTTTHENQASWLPPRPVLMKSRGPIDLDGRAVGALAVPDEHHDQGDREHCCSCFDRGELGGVVSPSTYA